MRIRNIKPEITKHEDLAELPRDHRLLFIYLWMMADAEGRLEDRPKRIRAELFPYDDDLTSERIDGMLGELAEAGFLVRYHAEGMRLIAIPSMTKHQTFSTWERKAGSKLPPPPSDGTSGSAPTTVSGPTEATSQRCEQPSEGPPEDYSSAPVALPPDVGRRTKDVGQGTKDGEALSHDAGASVPPAFGPEQLVEAWNAATGGRLKLEGQRRAAVRRAMKRRPDPEFWQRCFAKAASLKALPESQWLKLDWLLGSKKGAWNYDRIEAGEFDWKLERTAAPANVRPFRQGPAPLPEFPTKPQSDEEHQPCRDCGAVVLHRLVDFLWTPDPHDCAADGARSYA